MQQDTAKVDCEPKRKSSSLCLDRHLATWRFTPTGCSPVLLTPDAPEHYARAVVGEFFDRGAAPSVTSRVERHLYLRPEFVDMHSPCCVVALRVWLRWHERVRTTQAFQLFNLLLYEQHPENRTSDVWANKNFYNLVSTFWCRFTRLCWIRPKFWDNHSFRTVPVSFTIFISLWDHYMVAIKACRSKEGTLCNLS